ncbi:hypothetical protein A2159_02325 [Candidatus Woesebacteria bacterium RBG_13_34_9]|uniref:Uncharacterized protein n=1 Tax=Candidatus Woesebacteria bacterium RBG_13_34_9 TaxID=1802477 RepID=A0A1F7X1D6_9BACT|nr:MAG: hypothetical protein A2159_02325 [Candidatus Woesebacteria bacterium RBG_13_34_9]
MQRHEFTPQELDGPKGPTGYPLTEPPRGEQIPYVHQGGGEGAVARFKSLLRHKRHLRHLQEVGHTGSH